MKSGRAGVEFSKRDLKVPFKRISSSAPPETREVDWKDYLGRAYIDWTPHPWLATSAELLYERFDRDPEFPGDELFTEVETLPPRFVIDLEAQKSIDPPAPVPCDSDKT